MKYERVCSILPFCWFIRLHVYLYCSIPEDRAKKFCEVCCLGAEKAKCNRMDDITCNPVSSRKSYLSFWIKFCRRIDGVLVGKTAKCRQRMEVK